MNRRAFLGIAAGAAVASALPAAPHDLSDWKVTAVPQFKVVQVLALVDWVEIRNVGYLPTLLPHSVLHLAPVVLMPRATEVIPRWRMEDILRSAECVDDEQIPQLHEQGVEIRWPFRCDVFADPEG